MSDPEVAAQVLGEAEAGQADLSPEEQATLLQSQNEALARLIRRNAEILKKLGAAPENSNVNSRIRARRGVTWRRHPPRSLAIA